MYLWCLDKNQLTNKQSIYFSPLLLLFAFFSCSSFDGSVPFGQWSVPTIVPFTLVRWRNPSLVLQVVHVPVPFVRTSSEDWDSPLPTETRVGFQQRTLFWNFMWLLSFIMTACNNYLNTHCGCCNNHKTCKFLKITHLQVSWWLEFKSLDSFFQVKIYWQHNVCFQFRFEKVLIEVCRKDLRIGVSMNFWLGLG